MFINKIRSRIDLQLGVIQAVILTLIMIALYVMSSTLESQLTELREDKYQFVSDMNNELRQEIFASQKQLTDISLALDVSPAADLILWLENQNPQKRLLNGRDEIKSIFNKRKERRDVTKPDKFVLKEMDGQAIVGIGVFSDGDFQDQVSIFTFPQSKFSQIESKIAEIQQKIKDPEHVKKQILSVKSMIANFALDAEGTRNQILEKIDHIHKKQVEVQSFENQIRLIHIIVQAGTVIFIVFILYFTGRIVVTKALIQLQYVARNITDQPDLHIPFLTRQNEIGSLARAIERFKDATLEADRLRTKQQEQKEKSRKKLEKRLNSVSDQLSAGMKTSFSNLSDLSNTLSNLTKNISDTALNTTAQGETVLIHSAENSHIAKDVTGFVLDLSTQTEKLSNVIDAHKQQTQQTLQETSQIQTQVKDLQEAAAEVEDIVKLISDIASQTNLLALNATIESARAGEAGKGFAVVANEVKSLAQTSAASAGDISERVERIKNITNVTVSAIDDIAKHVTGLHEAMEDLTLEFGHQENLTSQISLKSANSQKTAQVLHDAGEDMTKAADLTTNSTAQLSKTSDAILTSLREMQEELNATLDMARGQNIHSLDMNMSHHSAKAVTNKEELLEAASSQSGEATETPSPRQAA